MPKVAWNKDIMARTRVAHRLVDGKLNGRHLIEHDSRISGGVYLSSSPRLAITVDGNSPELLRLHQTVLERASILGPLNEVEENIYLGHVCCLARQIIKNDVFNYMEIFEKFMHANDHEMPLDTFIKIEIGDCRMFALLAGALTEKLTDEGLLLGSVSIDRNTVEDKGGHVWTRYKDFCGTVTIIDATNDYIGPENGGRWVYKRE
jgi:hypothetical protein